LYSIDDKMNVGVIFLLMQLVPIIEDTKLVHQRKVFLV